MTTITRDLIMSFNPCYTCEELNELWGNAAEELTVEEFLTSDYENKGDLIWVVLREEFISEKNLHILACDFAEHALMRERESGREPHPDSWNAIQIKRLWIEGRATDEELVVASSAAWPAARSAAWYAEQSAAWSAAWSAARSAAWYAEQSAAWSAARSAEQEWQIEQILKVIKEGL